MFYHTIAFNADSGLALNLGYVYLNLQPVAIGGRRVAA